MRKIEFCIAAFVAFSACAEERITYRASDGVVEPPPSEKVTVYRLEVEGDSNFIVGADGVRRQVALMGADEYAQLAERVDAVWRIQNSTPEGRRRLHGAITNTVINAEKKRKEEYHADGYVHCEPVQIRRSVPPPPIVKRKSDERRNISRLHAEMRRKLEERSKGKPKTVTVEHDATTGKDIVK